MGKPLIIGVDLQVGFLTDEIRESGFMERIEKFLAGQEKERVVLTRFVNKPGSNFERLLDWPMMQSGDPDTSLFGDLEKAGFEVIEKSGYTAWLPAVKEKAEAVGADSVIIFGLDSDACVLKTALDVFEDHLQPVVLGDLCDSSGGSGRNENGLELLRTLIGVRQVTTSTTMSMP